MQHVPITTPPEPEPPPSRSAIDILPMNDSDSAQAQIWWRHRHRCVQHLYAHIRHLSSSENEYNPAHVIWQMHEQGKKKNGDRITYNLTQTHIAIPHPSYQNTGKGNNISSWVIFDTTSKWANCSGTNTSHLPLYIHLFQLDTRQVAAIE